MAVNDNELKNVIILVYIHAHIDTNRNSGSEWLIPIQNKLKNEQKILVTRGL
jgi:hypothetical protein